MDKKKKFKFDVVIGNPPYQEDDGGNGQSAKPIYHKFITQIIKNNPEYLSMIIPSRWFTGGKGLDTFREEMLSDKRIRKLVDFENFREVFQNVDLAGGACYFLWDRNHHGPCEVVNASSNNYSVAIRNLDKYEVFIRQNLAVKIVDKVCDNFKGDKFLNEIVSSRKPFGLPTNYEPKNKGIPCWFVQRVGLQYANESDIDDSRGYLNKWKLLVPKAPIAGQTDFTKPVRFYYDGNTRIAKPGECCTESWIVCGAFDTEEEVYSFRSYIFTRVVRFLLLQTVVSQDVTKKNFCFVPDLGKYVGTITDEYLCNIWGIDENEYNYIKLRIKETS